MHNNIRVNLATASTLAKDQSIRAWEGGGEQAGHAALICDVSNCPSGVGKRKIVSCDHESADTGEHGSVTP